MQSEKKLRGVWFTLYRILSWSFIQCKVYIVMSGPFSLAQQEPNTNVLLVTNMKYEYGIFKYH